jgi:hypothetical protein
VTRGRRQHAARYLRTLATIETLSALGNDSEVSRLLAGIDPIEARDLANEIEDADSAQVIPLGNPAVLSLYPQVTHAEDSWSRKVAGS